MRVREGVTVKLTREVVMQLKLLKLQLGKRSYDEVIRCLIENFRRGRIEI